MHERPEQGSALPESCGQYYLAGERGTNAGIRAWIGRAQDCFLSVDGIVIAPWLLILGSADGGVVVT